MTRVQFATIGVLLGIIAGMQTLPLISPNRAAPSWEYKIEGISDSELRSELARLGDGGWELAFARRAISGEGGERQGMYEVILKRPL
jgi:hypothetical protein